MLFETSLSFDHDQSSVYMRAQWPALSLAQGHLAPLLRTQKVGVSDNVTSRLCFLCYLLIFLLNVAFQLDPTSYVLRKL